MLACGMRMLTLLSLLAGVYVWWRAVWPLSCRWWNKLLLAAVIMGLALFFYIVRMLGGPLPFAPDLPGWFQLAFAWCYLVFMAFFLGLVAAHVVRGCVWLLVPAWRRWSRPTRRSVGNCAHLVLLVGVVLMVSVGMRNAFLPPEVREVRLSLPVSRELKVALLTDLHVDALKQREFMQDVVNRVNALEPDLVLIAGDCVDGTVEQRGSFLEPLRGLKSPVYAVLGNHEYYSGYEPWAQFLPTLGLTLLQNEHRYLEEFGLVLAGVTDPAARVYGLEPPDVEKALAGAPADKPVLLLAHQPQLALPAEDAGVALQLSGHTHGGLMPGLAEITARYNCGFVRGLYRLPSGMLLYTSPGTSLWSGLPLRLADPAEITLIKVESTKDEHARRL